MRTRLARIACLFVSAASATSAAVAVLGLASSPALAEEKSGPAQPGEKPSSAVPAGSPKADAAAPAGRAKAAAPRAGAKKKASEPPLPPAPARVWLIAPSPRGPWTLRIDNDGERPMRIPADVRLLRFEIDTLNKRTKKTVRCAAPAGLKPSGFPERRALLLAPGQSYMEHFDPRLLCFGKDAAALAGGSVVRAWYGWGPPPKWSRKAPSPPFAVESTDDPPAFAPATGLAAPTVVLSYGLPRKEAAADDPDGAEPPSPAGEQAQPSADAAARPEADETARPAGDKAAQASADGPAGEAAAPRAPSHRDHAAGSPGGLIVDANAPRLELTSEPWSDAASPRSIVVRVSARNAGKRPMTVAVRPRMLEFYVAGPNGTTVCEASPPMGAIPRDLYRTLKPGASVDLSLLLREVCPDNTFAREGLYRVTATLHANEPGTQLGLDAYTAIVPATNSTLLRVKSAPEPFYAAAPRPVPTPKPPEADEGQAPERDNEKDDDAKDE